MISEKPKSLNNLAFFAEGHTEVYFLEHLIRKIGPEEGYCLHIHPESRIDNEYYSLSDIELFPVKPGNRKTILLYNCKGETKIKSPIIADYPGLARAGSKIVALKDVYPKRKEEIPQIREDFNYGLPGPVLLVLATMEIEAWFIYELTHFEKIDSRLTPDYIRRELNLDLTKTNPADIAWPAELLDKIYSSVSKRYGKSKNRRERTIRALDYSALCSNGVRQLHDLKTVIECLVGFLRDR